MTQTRVLQPTPPSAVKDGKVVSFGLFREPFRDMNLRNVRLVDAGEPLGGFLTGFRLKQWQHIAFISRDFLLAFAIVDAHYMGSSFCYFVNRQTGEYFEHHCEAPGKAARISRELWHDDCRIDKRGYFIEVRNRLAESRHYISINISAKAGKPAIKAELEIVEDLQKVQPLIVILPINDEQRPLHTHKTPGPVSGEIQIGEQKYTLNEKHDIAMIDVQKTFYPFNTFWKWATCAGYDKEGNLIALNLVNNMIRNDQEFNENCLWVNDKLTPWSAVRFEFDENNILEPWHIRTTDGNCDLTFRPLGERADKINLGLILSDYHQPYGLFNGTVVDADGKTHELNDFFGVTEHHLARF
ncbi:MAG TPA: DUF2804 domain-containing protein [bacterium]|nr:DUF2804 domain-containing protein [bacterium]